MKKRNKILGLMVGAVALVGVSIMGTMAYLTATTDTVQNTFTVGNVTITLDEADINNTSNRTSEGNKYQLIPATTYKKDPTVTVTSNTADCFLFVKFEEKNNILKDTQNTQIVEFTTTLTPENGWTALSNNPGVFYRVVEKDDQTRSWVLLADIAGETGKNIKISEKLTNDTMPGTKYEADGETKTIAYPELDFTAYAVQSDGLSVTEAWDLVNSNN